MRRVGCPPARKAQPGWAARTAYNRSQILCRITELMEVRRDQFVAAMMAAEGVGRRRATRNADGSIDRWIWYAGWADKHGQVIGPVNPVNGSYLWLREARSTDPALDAYRELAAALLAL
jgi:acyl-CoA reductase-like NAD-dependent aldehyde dehydrogenase